MATYKDFNGILKEPVEVDANPQKRWTPQRVEFINNGNKFYGTFIGAINATNGISARNCSLSDVSLYDCNLYDKNGNKIELDSLSCAMKYHGTLSLDLEGSVASVDTFKELFSLNHTHGFDVPDVLEIGYSYVTKGNKHVIEGLDVDENCLLIVNKQSSISTICSSDVEIIGGNRITVDTELNFQSHNPVENQVISRQVQEITDKITGISGQVEYYGNILCAETKEQALNSEEAKYVEEHNLSNTVLSFENSQGQITRYIWVIDEKGNGRWKEYYKDGIYQLNEQRDSVPGDGEQQDEVRFGSAPNPEFRSSYLSCLVLSSGHYPSSKLVYELYKELSGLATGDITKLNNTFTGQNRFISNDTWFDGISCDFNKVYSTDIMLSNLIDNLPDNVKVIALVEKTKEIIETCGLHGGIIDGFNYSSCTVGEFCRLVNEVYDIAFGGEHEIPENLRITRQEINEVIEKLDVPLSARTLGYMLRFLDRRDSSTICALNELDADFKQYKLSATSELSCEDKIGGIGLILSSLSQNNGRIKYGTREICASDVKDLGEKINEKINAIQSEISSEGNFIKSISQKNGKLSAEYTKVTDDYIEDGGISKSKIANLADELENLSTNYLKKEDFGTELSAGLSDFNITEPVKKLAFKDELSTVEICGIGDYVKKSELPTDHITSSDVSSIIKSYPFKDELSIAYVSDISEASSSIMDEVEWKFDNRNDNIVSGDNEFISTTNFNNLSSNHISCFFKNIYSTNGSLLSDILSELDDSPYVIELAVRLNEIIKIADLSGEPYRSFVPESAKVDDLAIVAKSINDKISGTQTELPSNLQQIKEICDDAIVKMEPSDKTRNLEFRLQLLRQSDSIIMNQIQILSSSFDTRLKNLEDSIMASIERRLSSLENSMSQVETIFSSNTIVTK